MSAPPSTPIRLVEPIQNGQLPPRTPAVERLQLSPRADNVFTPDKKTTKPLLMSPGRKKADQPEAPESVEKTNTVAGLLFGAALLSMSGSGFCLYWTWRDRRVVLLLPAALWTLVSIIIGTIAETLAKQPKVETAPAEARNLPTPAPIVYERGQPIPIENVGNTCFMNSPLQGMMNDARYPQVFKEICERGKRRNEAYQKFLNRFPSQSSWVPGWAKNLTRKSEGEQPLIVQDLQDVLVILSRQIGPVTNFSAHYPQVAALVNRFKAVRKESAIPIVDNTDAALIAELTQMKTDQTMLQFFDKQRAIAERDIRGFNAFLTLINAYEQAQVQEPHAVYFGGWRAASSIGEIRNLMGVDGQTQEDVEELLHCLTKYIFAEDHPDVFFLRRHVQHWVECPVQDEVVIREMFERHQRAANPNELLTVLPLDNMTTGNAEPASILTILDVLSAGAVGQTLMDQTLQERETNSDPVKSATVFLKNGVPRQFYPDKERFVIEGNPQRFILQLKRWKEGGVKDHSKVTMPLDIKMNGQRYQLRTIVVHSGFNSHGGHYHAMVHANRKWWYASDSHIYSDFVEKDVKTALKYGYLYFYTLKIHAG